VAAPTGAPSPSPDPGQAVGPLVPGRGTDGGGPDDPTFAGPFNDDGISQVVIVATALSTAITLAVAFVLFGRRRRRDEDGELALATAAATSYGAATAAPPPQVLDPGTGGLDADLPRWRRPSLIAARKSDPGRGGPIAGAAAAGHLSFVPGTADAALERRIVRYRIVRLLDQPDELLGATVGSLDEGDEVAIVEESGLYRRVVTPDGRSGWLHRMTLGEVIEAASAEAEEEIDPDVLLAYLAARGRA
jgi:hypothetical protein